MFDSVPISIGTPLKSEAESFKCSSEVSGIIEKKRDARSLLFLVCFTRAIAE